MTKRVQLVRHDNAGANAFLGKIGEITVNTGNKSVHVHDGINEGGTEQARADLSNVAVATSSNVGKMSAQQAGELVQALLDIITNAGNITSNDTDIAANLAAIQSNDTDIANNVAAIATNTTKLSGIENGADVTDTANVTAAGALMDSEVDADLKTFSLPASTTISAFIRTLLDDAAASNARTTLGLGGLAILNTVGAAQIDADAVGSSEIAANAVGTSELTQTVGSTGSQGLADGATWIPAAGFYNVVCDSAPVVLQIFTGAVWRSGQSEVGGLIWFDGTNMRIKNNSGGSVTLYYQKLA